MRPSPLILVVVLGACAPAPTHGVPQVSGTSTATSVKNDDVTTHFDFLEMDRVVGHPTFSRHPDGSYDEDYEFSDRGRGPKLHIHSAIAPDGIPSSVTVSGTDYLHRDAREAATCHAATCAWRTTLDYGEATRAFYTTVIGGLHLHEALLREARANPDASVALLPSGRAHAERATEVTVMKDGQPLHLVGWRWTGFACDTMAPPRLTPSIEWFDDDGHLFGFVGDWLSTVREGWEVAIPTLLTEQKRLEVAWRESVVNTIAHRPPHGLAIVHARLFDPVALHTSDDVTIVIEGDYVKAVRAGLAPPPGHEVINAKGKTVLPGLWDMHVHATDDDGLLDLAEGVTTVRDMGNDIDSSVARRERWSGATDIGPHLILAGWLDSPGPYQGPTKVLVTNEAEARAAVDGYATKGYEQIKIYSSTKPELVPAIVNEAHVKGMRVSGHVPAHMIAEDAVRAGFDEIQHITFLVLDLVADRTTETETSLRLTIPPAKAAGIDLDAPRTGRLLDLLAARQTVIDPTLTGFEDDWTTRMDHPSQAVAPVLARLPPQVQRAARACGVPVPEGLDATFHESFTRCEQLVKRLWDRKIPIVAGTDESFEGFALHRELELYAEAGIPNADVLAIATIGAARVMKRDTKTGAIASGKDADLVIIDGDPLARMQDVRNIVTVVKSGMVIDALAAQSALSIARETSSK